MTTPTKKSWKKWFIAILVLIVCAYVAYSWLRFRANLSFTGYDWSHTTDTEVVNLQVGSHRFGMPKNYLLKSGTQRSGVYNYFTITLLMPDFKPYSEELKEEFNTANGKPLIDIGISTRRRQPNITQMFHNLTQKIGRAEQLPESMAPGLKQYRSQLGSPTEMFFRFDGDQVTHFMTCTPVKAAPSPSCDVDIDYSNDVVVRYNFKRSYLDRWQWVDEQVRALLAEWERNGAIDKR